MLSAATAWSSQPTLDELLDLDAPAPADTAPPDATDDTDSDRDANSDANPDAGAALPVDPTVRRLLDGDEAADAFAEAVKDMDAVSLRLGQALDPGLDTQRMQESILARLDQVIAAARQQQQSSSSSSSSSSASQGEAEPSASQDPGSGDNAAQTAPTAGQQGAGAAQAGRAQSDQAGTGDGSPGSPRGTAEERGLRELRREWGNLPPRLREEISEGLNERFSPVYRRQTEAYYRRLAEEE